MSTQGQNSKVAAVHFYKPPLVLLAHFSKLHLFCPRLGYPSLFQRWLTSDTYIPLKYSILTHIWASLFYVTALATQLPFRKKFEEIILLKICIWLIKHWSPNACCKLLWDKENLKPKNELLMMIFNADHCIWAKKRFVLFCFHILGYITHRLEDGCLSGIYIISFPIIFLLIQPVIHYGIAWH